MKKWIEWFFLPVIILLSFFFFSSNFYPLLNSDDAVSILMIHRFSFPEDLYFWGQDRYGSLIPLLGQPLNKIVGLSAITTESIVHYIILIGGYWGYSTLFRSGFVKLIFACVWFWPPVHMIDLLRYNLGISASLIGAAIGMINSCKNNEMNDLRSALVLFLIILLLTASIWVSDLAMFTVFILITFCLIHFVYSQKQNWLRSVLYKRSFWFGIIGIISAYLFISFAKSSANTVNDYTGINSAPVVLESVLLFLKYLINIFIFRMNEPFTGVYVILAAGLLILFNRFKKSTIIFS